MQVTEYAVEWIMPLDRITPIMRDASRYPTRQAAEEDVALAFRNRWHWSREYRIVELPALGCSHRHDEA